MEIRKTDVTILGAGPAGCAAGLALAGTGRVVLIEREGEPKPKIGESLVPAARRLLHDLGVLPAHEGGTHLAYLGNRSIWGSDQSHETDFMRDPDGPGWHLNRLHFEQMLRDQVQHSGAELIAPARLVEFERIPEGWHIQVQTQTGLQTWTTRLLIDASGRNAYAAKRAGAERIGTDGLVATWLYGAVERELSHTAGFSVVQSEPNGWWYSAPVPVSRHSSETSGSSARVLCFHTDADLVADTHRSPQALLQAAHRLPELSQLLNQVNFQHEGSPRSTSASSSHLESFSGTAWLAVGDAALSLDPLASRGIFQALYTGLKGGQACAAHLRGNDSALEGYDLELTKLRAAYEQQLDHFYGTEKRWPSSAFWQRRSRMTTPHLKVSGGAAT